MTQNQVNTAVKAFIKNFIDNPYLHRTEHSLHVALFEELFKESPQTFEFYDDKSNQTYKTNFVHKEFPGRRANTQPTTPQTKLVDRTQIDIVVLKENQPETPINDFRDGNLDVDFAFEMSLEAGIKHLCWDIFKFITGSNKSIEHKNYIIHLYHENRVQQYFNKDKIQGDTMWSGERLCESALNMKIEWCYYLIQLCINYSQNQDTDSYTKIMAIINHFVCKYKKDKIKIEKDEIDYEDYLPTESYIQAVLKNMKFVMVDANPDTKLRFDQLIHI
jgi:hypothetical protein